jgi:hypothetical protein
MHSPMNVKEISLFMYPILRRKQLIVLSSMASLAVP